MMDVTFVAELCYNHGGSIDKAIAIIDAFKFCDVFKFQKMHPKTFLSKENYNKKCPKNENYFAEIYGKHREFVELSIEDHIMIRDYVQAMGKKWACSTCDIPSAAEIIPLNPYYVKIPSCRCNNFTLVDYCLKNFKGMVHVSTGMTTRKERQSLLVKSNNIVPYSCTSDYSGDGDIYIERMRGFSCHVPDVFYAQAAILNGARFVEYHCTLDRSWPGSDNKISLLPGEYSKLVKWHDNNSDKLVKIKYKKPDQIPHGELAARKKLWSTA
jgi:N-acetylneuraminate synthase